MSPNRINEIWLALKCVHLIMMMSEVVGYQTFTHLLESLIAETRIEHIVVLHFIEVEISLAIDFTMIMMIIYPVMVLWIVVDDCSY